LIIHVHLYEVVVVSNNAVSIAVMYLRHRGYYKKSSSTYKTVPDERSIAKQVQVKE
jgi:hypothetical protein